MGDLSTTAFYQDFDFWMALSTFVAIILSQIPPLRIVLRPKRLRIEIHRRAHVTHQIGNPKICLHIGVANTGGRTVRVSNISISVSRDNVALVTLPAQTYISNNNEANPFIFMPFSLKPEETWAYRVNFFNELPRDTQTLFRQGVKELQTNNNSEMPIPPHFQVISSKLFIWEPGEYTIEIATTTTPLISNINKTFRFTIFESDRDALHNNPIGDQAGAHISSDISDFPEHRGLKIGLLK